MHLPRPLCPSLFEKIKSCWLTASCFLFRFSFLLMCLVFGAKLGDGASGETVKGYGPSSSICRFSFLVATPGEHSACSQGVWGQGGPNHTEHFPAVSQTGEAIAWEHMPSATYVFTHLFWCIHLGDSYGEMPRSLRLRPRRAGAHMRLESPSIVG